MCGICGKVNFEPENMVDKRLIQGMCDLIRHRGPDDEGYYVKGKVGLGVKRLSIIDIAGGRQPISNESKDIWIVFNGEIYNYLELRRELESKGHLFATNSDTETILHAYEEYGEECVQKLRGMFAFAIWDEKRQMLFLARDRIGIKPLYYALTGESFLFGSEIKALLLEPTLRPELDPVALQQFLTITFVPAPRTMFRGIYKLLPGHTLTYKDGKVEIKRYWNLDASVNEDRGLRYYLNRLRELLVDAVQSHLISEVPLGVFLSGGVDSSTIVALMSKSLKLKVETFSIGFRQAEGFNELPYARLIAQRFGTDHHEFILEPQSVETLTDLLWHLDEPLGDAAVIPLYQLCQMAREHVTVVLMGEGGDETFAGYPRYYWHCQTELYNHLPYFLRRYGVELATHILPEAGPLPWRELVRRARKFTHGAALPEAARYASWFTIFGEEAKQELCTEALRDHLEGEEVSQVFANHFGQAPFSDPLSRAQYLDIKTYLLDNLLLKADKLTSAASLEGRVPFLDHRLVEFVASIPPRFKLRRMTGKYILKQLMAEHLPPPTLNRRKQGFMVPIERWFNRDLRGYAREILLDRTTLSRGWFNAPALEKLLGRLDDARFHNAERVFALVVLELWARLFLDYNSKLCL